METQITFNLNLSRLNDLRRLKIIGQLDYMSTKELDEVLTLTERLVGQYFERRNARQEAYDETKNRE